MTKDKNATPQPFGDVLKDIKGGLEPHNFSKKMCESIENQVDINSAIKNLIQVSLKNDVNMQNTIKNIINKHIIYKIGLWLPTIISATVSIILMYLSK